MVQQVTFAQLALGALSTIQTATVRADDDTQVLLASVKSMLRGIANGQLIVTPVPPAVVAAPTDTRGGKIVDGGDPHRKGRR